MLIFPYDLVLDSYLLVDATLQTHWIQKTWSVESMPEKPKPHLDHLHINQSLQK